MLLFHTMNHSLFFFVNLIFEPDAVLGYRERIKIKGT